MSLCENIDTHNETPVWQLYCKHCFLKRYLKSVRNGECTKMLNPWNVVHSRKKTKTEQTAGINLC